MEDEIKKYLYDIKISIESFDDYLGPVKSFSFFEENKIIRRAV